MKKYLFLTDYQTGLIVKTEILEAENEKNVVLKWIKTLRFPYIGSAARKKIQEEYLTGVASSACIRRMQGLHCMFFFQNNRIIDGHFLDVSSILQGSTESKRNLIIAYFKGGIYISKSKAELPLTTISHWARYLSWHYYSKEERAEIRKNIYNIKELNETLKDLVWNFECSILGNNLKVYIVKS